MRIKNTFASIVYNESERVLVEHKEACLKINGKQTVKLRSDSN